MRIVYMGTPEFAVAPLAKLIEANYSVVSVVTAPDRPAGRGKKLQASAVKIFAEANQIPILQPEKLRDPQFIEALAVLQADLFVVVAFRMLPQMVWSIPTIGTFNLHASLLPDYRGAAPINWVLINGETRTGVTTFLIDEQIDTGKLLLQEETEIPFEWNAGHLHDQLMEMGADLVLATVKGLESDSIQPTPQDDKGFLHPAPKIFKEDCRIDWERSAKQNYNHIRGLSPYPVARTTLDKKLVKIYKSSVGELLGDEDPGVLMVHEQHSQLQVACVDRWLIIEELQLEGRRRMNAAEFLAGYKDRLDRFV